MTRITTVRENRPNCTVHVIKRRFSHTPNFVRQRTSKVRVCEKPVSSRFFIFENLVSRVFTSYACSTTFTLQYYCYYIIDHTEVCALFCQIYQVRHFDYIFIDLLDRQQKPAGLVPRQNRIRFEKCC